MSTWLGCRLPLLLGPAGSSASWAARLGLSSTSSSPGGCRCRLLSLRRRRCLLRPEDGLWGGFSRALGTHPRKEPMEALNTAQGARDFIYSLHSTERSCLLRELHRFESIAIAQGKAGERERDLGVSPGVFEAFLPLPCEPGSKRSFLQRENGEQ